MELGSSQDFTTDTERKAVDSVMVSGLLKNISDKVTTKLDPESEDELVQIISRKMEGGGVEEGVSFEDWPNSEYVINSATQGRVKGTKDRRLPSVKGKNGQGEEYQEEGEYDEDNSDEEELEGKADVDDDFDSLLATIDSSTAGTSLVGNEVEEDVDDAFDSLLKESSEDTENDGDDTPRKRSLDDDFNL